MKTCTELKFVEKQIGTELLHLRGSRIEGVAVADHVRQERLRQRADLRNPEMLECQI